VSEYERWAAFLCPGLHDRALAGDLGEGVGAYDAGRKVEREADFAPLPKEFWWAEGHDALIQDWATGDFSTWIDDKFHLQAFGTEFSRADVLAMLPKRVEHEQAEPDAPLPQESEPVTALVAAPRKGAKGGRSLTFNHPYAAARAALDLKDTPLEKRSELTHASVGAVMEPYYRLASGKVPSDLDDNAKGVIEALKDYWKGCD